MRGTNKHFQSLASRLNQWIIPLGASILITVLSANYFLSRLLLDYYVENLTQTTASATVRKIETIFNTVATSANSLASIVSTSDTSIPDATKKQIHQSIKSFINTNTSIFGMAVALEPHTLIESLEDYSPYYYRKENKLAFSDLADNSYNYQVQPWYSRPKLTAAPVWSEPYFDEGGGDVRMITYSAPMYLSDNTTFAGIATADIQLSWLDEIINEMEIGNSGFGFILSNNDIVIAHSDKSINLTQLNKDEVEPDKWQHYINSKKNSSTVHFKSSCSKQLATEKCRFAIQSLSNSGWKVVIVLPEKELATKINSLTTKISIIAVIGLVILFIVVNFVTSYLTKPLSKLASATKDIGAGQLDTKIPQPVRKDEIGALTDDFSSMRSALKTHIREVQEATAKQQKLESEIQIAKDIQMSMIPGAGNAVITNDDFQLYALLRPARSVGGDLYYFQQSDSMLHFILGDVSDKGVPAALFMAKAPIIQGIQNTQEHDIEGATALGLMEDVDYPDITFQLEHNSSIVMYTDGISEAHDKNNQQYTDEKLVKLISTIGTNSVEVTGKTIIDSVDTFAGDTEQFDDITLLIIHYE
jgi:sigma-B regulation protein RsbU (phosphoserine phosphatase)